LDQENGGIGLTLGVGTINGGFRFDYAYVQRPGLPDDDPHYFTLSYVGERVLTTDYKLLRKIARLKFLSPPDRLITDKDEIFVTAEAWGEKALNKKRTWTVTALSATFEVQELTTREDLAVVNFNGKEANNGTIEGYVMIKDGRNVIPLIGFTRPEISGGNPVPTVAGTAELKVLRILPFKDVSLESWAVEPISLNVTLGLVSGYPKNEFKPEKGITRAELVTLLVRSLGVAQETLDPLATYEVFSDVPRKHWAAKYIIYGNALKLVSGYADGTFKPNNFLNRAEGVAILARYAGLGEDAGSSAPPFPDLKAGFWANKYIAPAKAAGLLKFLAGQDFRPAGKFTRAEACEVLYRVPAIQKKVDEFWETGIISAGTR
ncbi:MAG TPA: S-layer homology domain-containing protein, partial [Candidatus Sulfotelmatobacter sp.]|nr:S-layer homology domain-containing protein [Candidatus Sulfotelmatobacter sp.]